MVFERAELSDPEDYLPDCPVPISAYGFSKLTVRSTAALRTRSTACRTRSAGRSTPMAPVRCGRGTGIAHAVRTSSTRSVGQNPLQIFGSGEQTRTLTHIDDIADGSSLR